MGGRYKKAGESFSGFFLFRMFYDPAGTVSFSLGCRESR